MKFDKPGGFIGREALLEEREKGPARRLLQFRLTDPEPLLYHNEPIWHGDTLVGYVTSGAYGHTLGGAIGLGYIDTAGAPDPGEGGFSIEVAGERVPAEASSGRCTIPGTDASGVDGGSRPLEIHAVNLRETVPRKIYDSLGLLEGDVAEQRLVATVGGLHIDEEHLCEHLAEGPEPQEDRSADVAGHDRLIGRFDVHCVVDRELAEARPPGVRQSQIRRTGVDQDIADHPATGVRGVFDRCFDDYSTHLGVRNGGLAR